jgi:hypothetical protein
MGTTMSITARTVTKIICDGAHAPCREGSEVTFAQPQQIALRLASRAGWYVSEAYICPVCATTAGVAKTVSFVSNILKSSLDLGNMGDLRDRRYEAPGAA